MKIKRILTTIAVVASVAIAFAMLRPATPAEANVRSAVTVLPPAPDPTPTPCPNTGPECYTVLPSDTDGTSSPLDCIFRPTEAIGCEQWPNGDDDDGNNNLHYLYLPPDLTTDTGKLLVLLGGGNGNSAGIATFIGPVAAARGYRVIGLTYPAAPANKCANLPIDHQAVLDCFGDAYYEVATGTEMSPSAGGDRTSVGEHKQDSIANRLLRVLQWACANKGPDGWCKYLDNGTEVNWSEIHLAGHSNGSSHSSFMGSIEEFKDVGRVSLFAGPDDGDGGADEPTWDPSTYIADATTDTATRYYGLVHFLNKARKLSNGEENDPFPAYQVYKNWNTFGMEEPYNQHRFEFDPSPGFAHNFGNAHMLISMDPRRETANANGLGTTEAEAHNSVIKDLYCAEEDVNGDYHCNNFGVHHIGYVPAWNCILGSGDKYASTKPVSNAGPNQMVECEGGGGTTVQLDGSGSTDVDCDILTYAWSGPFGSKTGRNPSVFCSLGFNFIGLVASDDWWESLVPSTTLVNVVDTTPPSLDVVLSRTILWPADHRLVRIDATVTSSDSCGAAPVQVVLTSITNSQADNGLGDGDTDRDIQEASYETFDTSFVLRAERAGNVTAGRTYTVKYTATDASGNQTEVSTTVRVPHSQ